MINENFQVTFGVELELVFAFHEDLLRAYLRRIHDNSHIVKDFSEEDRATMARQLNVGYTDRPRYMGWGLTGQTQHPLIGWNSRHLLRTYGDEPMQIARRRLPNMYDVAVHFDTAKQTDFSRWHLTHDGSVTGADRGELRSQLADRIVSIKQWDSHGIELVSRVLSPEPEDFLEISAILNALRGRPGGKYGALTTEHCGLHIHVGLPPIAESTKFENPRFDLATLQHLAYILVMYESHTSTLHPFHRREGSPAASTDIASNLSNFRRAHPRLLTTQVFHSATGTHTPVSQMLNIIDLSAVRAKIWRNGMTVHALANLMGSSRAHIVNWSYLHRLPSQGPRTLEFRQHEGCLEPQAVRWWILFCVGLVRLANHMARADPNGTGDWYRDKEWTADAAIWDLFRLMQFPAEGTDYFRKRAAFWEDEMKGVQPFGAEVVRSGWRRSPERDEEMEDAEAEAEETDVTMGTDGVSITAPDPFSMESRGPEPPRRDYSPDDI